MKKYLELGYNYFWNYYFFAIQIPNYISGGGKRDIYYCLFIKSFCILYNRDNLFFHLYSYLTYEYITQLILCFFQNIFRLNLKLSLNYRSKGTKIKYMNEITLLNFLAVRAFNILYFIKLINNHAFNNFIERLLYSIFNFIFNISKSLILIRILYTWQYILVRFKFYTILQYSIYLNYYLSQILI